MVISDISSLLAYWAVNLQHLLILNGGGHKWTEDF